MSALVDISYFVGCLDILVLSYTKTLSVTIKLSTFDY